MLSPALRYTILRLLAFFVCMLLLAAIPWMRAHLLVMLIVAGTVSMLFSLFFLNGPRDEMSAKIAERVEHRVEAKHAAAEAREHGGAPAAAGRAAGRPMSDEDAEDAQIAAAEAEHYR